MSDSSSDHSGIRNTDVLVLHTSGDLVVWNRSTTGCWIATRDACQLEEWV